MKFLYRNQCVLVCCRWISTIWNHICTTWCPYNVKSVLLFCLLIAIHGAKKNGAQQTKFQNDTKHNTHRTCTCVLYYNRLFQPNCNKPSQYQRQRRWKNRCSVKLEIRILFKQDTRTRTQIDACGACAFVCPLFWFGHTSTCTQWYNNDEMLLITVKSHLLPSGFEKHTQIYAHQANKQNQLDSFHIKSILISKTPTFHCIFFFIFKSKYYQFSLTLFKMHYIKIGYKIWLRLFSFWVCVSWLVFFSFYTHVHTLNSYWRKKTMFVCIFCFSS